jgi:hypothetical protein
MKKLTFLAIFLASTLSATAFAGDSQFSKFSDRFDSNNDGKISLSELPNSRMGGLDTNNDGYVSEAEMTARGGRGRPSGGSRPSTSGRPSGSHRPW